MKKCANRWRRVLCKIGSCCASCLLHVRKVGIASCGCLVMSIRMFSSWTHELSLLLYCVASFPGSPLAPTKNKNGGGEPGNEAMYCALDYLAMVI